MNSRNFLNVIVVLVITLAWTQAVEDENASSYRGIPHTNYLKLSIPVFAGNKLNREQRMEQLKAQKKDFQRKGFVLEEQTKLLQTINKLADDKVTIDRNNEAFVFQHVELSKSIITNDSQPPKVIEAPVPETVTMRVLNFTDSITRVHACYVCKQWYVIGHLVRFPTIEKELSFLLKGKKKDLDEKRIIPPDYWHYSEDLLSKSIRNQVNFFKQMQEWGLMGWYIESTKLIPIIQAGDLASL
jgi:hypothetical protein